MQFKVTNNHDSGAGSLRQAIIDASNIPGVDTIDLTGVSGTINLNSSLGTLNAGNDINFVDDGNTTINGQNARQIITVNGANVTFSRLTFANGLATGGDGNNGGGGGLGAGGALFINAGNVSLNNITFTGNRAVGGNGGFGNVTGGDTGSNGSSGGIGGGLNSTNNGGWGGSGGTRSGNYGNPGVTGGPGGFGAGGGGGGGGGGATSGRFGSDPEDNGGNGGAGGAGGFGAGGGGGGGGGRDYDYWSGNEHGSGGAGGAGGQFGGAGAGGQGGDDRSSGRGGGGAGLGGAIFVNSGASLTLLNSVFTGNSVAGGVGANNGQGVGTNIFVRDGATAQAIGANYSDTHGTINAVSLPNNYYQYNGSIYRLSTAGTWRQTQLQAQSLGGNLVTINNQAEQHWLVTTFGGTEQLWIGLTDEETEGTYKWVTGETYNFNQQDWFIGEPNNAGNEDYVVMNFGLPGKWNDYLSTGSRRGIIETKFYEWNGSKYLLTGPGTWEQAQAQAQSLGGNLVTINSQAEQDWLVNTFGGTEQLWIGLTDKVTEGQFKWATGETYNFNPNDWTTAQPDNWNNEDYVGMNANAPGKWNDYGSTSSLRGIIEINQYAATGRNTDSQFFVLAKPEKFDISVLGGFGPDIFQLRSYDGLTTSQEVTGSGGSDIFNISIEASSGTVGLDFNTGKLKQLAELLVTPDWDVREKRYAADISAAYISAGIDYAAAAAQALDITGLADGAIDAIATTAHLANDVANIAANYILDIEEYQNSLADIGNFFDGQGANGWGTVNVTQRRSIVEIMDFQPGIDTITLPKLTGNQAYRYTLVSGINGTGVEVAYNNGTNQPSTFLRIYIDQTLLPIVQGQSVGIAQFIESLYTNNGTHGVIGTTRNNSSKVAVTGADYTGTIAGDYIYVAQNNPTVGSVKIYGLAGDDILAGRRNGTNEIYGGEGDDFIVPGGVNDIIDGGTGYDQVNYSQNAVGISITSSNSTNFKNVESVVGTIYNDTINFSDLQVAPEDGVPINLEGRAGNDNLIGSQYQDVIDGEDGNDTLNGGDGNDTLNGGAGIDSLIGGLGNDTYIVDTTTDMITENPGEGTDTISSSVSFSLAALANIENLTLTGTGAINGTGNTANNVITGNSGNNTLNGGDGIDTLIGGNGDDTYIVDTTTDIITENVNEGTDTIQSSVSFSLATLANIENLTLTGTGAINGTGNAANNVITGNSGNNILYGESGNDTLNGEDGNDLLYGDVADYGGATLFNYNGNTYLLTTAGTWQQAQAQAQSLGGNLVTINSQAEQDWLVSTFGGSENFWIGFTDEVTEGQFKWVSGETSTYTNWQTGEPNNAGNEDYVEMYTNGKWNDLPSGFPRRGIVEIVAANDILNGGAGNDTLNGGAGIDTLNGGNGDDTYIVDTTTDTITENANEGTDTIQSSVSFNLAALPNVENLTLTGTGAINGTGNAGNNVIIGNAGTNTLNGGAGNDTLNGSAGIDTLIGGLGNDTYIVDSTTDTITENVGEGTDTIQSSITFSLEALANIENLTLTGTDAINGTGNTANNVITGNSGNNTLNGGDGIDTLIGGLSDDIYIVDSTTDTITENVGEGTDTIQSSITFSLAALTNIENLTLTGTGTINGTGNAANNVITGNSGNNTLNGGAGIDTLIGGLGNDTYIVDTTTDMITENVGEGTDTISSSVTFSLATLANIENLTLTGTAAINGTGNAGNNVITGNAGTNTLNGGDGNDTLNGGAGIDTLIGGLGNDTYIVDTTTDTITENVGQGTDTIQSSVTFSLAALANIENLTLTGTGAINGTGNTANNVITGNSGNNTLDGGNGNDTVNGGAANDILNGGDGNDRLTGGTGKDTLTGGLGVDRFDYRNLGDSLLSNFDVITDFNANAGNDLFLVSTARAGFSNAGNVVTLDATGIAAQLNTVNFAANFAAQFTFGSRSFVAINDATAGFSATTDAIIEVTGLTGSLGISNFTTSLV